MVAAYLALPGGAFLLQILLWPVPRTYEGFADTIVRVVSSLPWSVLIGIAILLTGLMGIIIDRGAYRPLRKSPRISALITAIGISFLLENLVLVIMGGRPKGFPMPELFAGTMKLGQLFVSHLSLWIFGITTALLVGVMMIVYRTRVGMAMRALSRDVETVRLMGIDADRIISFTFFLGSVLAAIGGIFWCMKYPALEPFMGVIPGLKAFVAAVLGGIGNVAGAALGGLILGVAEVLIVAIKPEWSGYRDAIAFAILILILLTRPTGIMGEELPD
jgi:branched-chain amino acid transport system permease protein